MAVYTDANSAKLGSLAATDLADIDIEELARVRLQHSAYRAIRRVNCRFDGNILTLTGHLPTYHYKQLAQVAVAKIKGVQQIVNDITVG